MSIDFFLHSKKMYRCIEYNLKEIIELYKEFIELTENEEETAGYDKKRDINFLNEMKNDYEEKIKKIHYFKDYVNSKIISLCNHNIVEDTIDKSPDSSQNIKYCTNCEYTFN